MDGERDEILGEEPPDEVRRSSLVLCGRCTVQTGGSSAISVSQKVTTRESDGQPPNLKHTRAARAVTAVAEVPSEVVQEQVSKGRSPGIGLAEGAVKEVKGKIRTVRHAAEAVVGRQIPKHHDVRVEGWCRRSCKPSAGNLHRVTVSNESLPFMQVFSLDTEPSDPRRLGSRLCVFRPQGSSRRPRSSSRSSSRSGTVTSRCRTSRKSRKRCRSYHRKASRRRTALCQSTPEETWKAAQIVQNRTADDVPRSVSVHAPQIIEETVDVVDIEQITTQERVQNLTEEPTVDSRKPQITTKITKMIQHVPRERQARNMDQTGDTSATDYGKNLGDDHGENRRTRESGDEANGTTDATDIGDQGNATNTESNSGDETRNTNDASNSGEQDKRCK